MTLHYKTAGESHGPQLTAITSGVPAGLKISTKDINRDLARRQLGHGRGGRMKIETDSGEITAGLRHGLTLGSPISITIKNADWKNWRAIMSIEKKDVTGNKKLVVPRPGHADLAGVQKYGLDDIRSVLERASARETAARVAVGAIARRILAELDIAIVSHVVQIGRVRARKRRLSIGDFTGVDKSAVRCLDEKAAKDMVVAINAARKAGESLGGVFEVIAFGLPAGLGSYVSGPERLGGRIASALMSIPAIKGAELGDGFSLAATPGSKAHDEIFFDPEKGYYRKTNRSGGLEGGMTTGEPVVARACMKPIPTLTKPLNSVNMRTGKGAHAFKERSDVCAVPAAAVVGEAMIAIELARALMEKFGGDCMTDLKESYLVYLRRLRGSWVQP
ncbi:MAG: chorismate synthase [Thermoleophilia bacterium]